jgi:hypothetical protein
VKENINEERSKVQHYYSTFLSQIDEYEEELKTSISIMMGHQKKSIAHMIEDLERRYKIKLDRTEKWEREIEGIA